MSAGASATRRRTVVPFAAADGFKCRLIHIERDTPPTRSPVLLVHGAGVRSNIFLPPNDRTIVDALVEAGHDVWLEDWRASIDLEPNPWTLDRAARFDHPVAVRTVVERTGARSIQAIVQCQGSTSFMMSAIAGLVPEVTTIVSNAVSLHTVVPWLSRFKLHLGVPVFRHMSDHMNPQWGIAAPTIPAKLVRAVVNATHHECKNPVCKQVSFTYGAGFPSLWRHENLSDETHEWIGHEFGFCSMAFFSQIGKCARAGHLVAVDGLDGLPRDFTAAPPRTNARVVFVAGAQNQCFLPESQERSFTYFDRLRSHYHRLHVIPGYSHLDIFIGRHAARDVFPMLLAELAEAA
jgi:pimeloyl-ACP methyl ester carboxylesterase